MTNYDIGTITKLANSAKDAGPQIQNLVALVIHKIILGSRSRK